MSYKRRRPESGWSTAFLLLQELKKSQKYGNIGCHDQNGVHVLRTFVNMSENIDTDYAKIIKKEIDSFKPGILDISAPATLNLQVAKMREGVLDNPESFFNSRYSLREFKDSVVPLEAIEKVINLAIKTPSVCNRQPWHVYHSSDRFVIDSALKYQNGNKGFGHKVPNLMIITTDLRAFSPGTEHYQHWIEGGLISMSIIYALHATGIASCCLNWSQAPRSDLKLRKALDIKPSHTIIMMLAFGYPNDDNVVCGSYRRPLHEVYTALKVRDK